MSPSRVCCDFNDRIDSNTYGLRVRGTRADLDRQHLGLAPGLELTLYDYDGFENGEPAWTVADAIVVDEPGIGLVARVQPDAFRWEPRAEHHARIHWSLEQLRIGLPRFTETIDPAWFADEASGDGWVSSARFVRHRRSKGRHQPQRYEFL